MKQFNLAKPFTTCTNKQTKQLTYIQDGETFTQEDVNKNNITKAETVETETVTVVTQKIPEPTDEYPAENVILDKEEILADVERHDNTVADPSQTDGADEVKLYNRKQDAKAAITRNDWKMEDYDILPYQDKFIIQVKG